MIIIQDKRSSSTISHLTQWIFLSPPWMITNLASRWTLARCRSTIQGSERDKNVTKESLTHHWLCLTKKPMKKQPKLWNSEKVKASSLPSQLPRVSWRIIKNQMTSQMRKSHNHMILDLSVGTISQMDLETRKLADLATHLDSFRLSNLDLSWSMVRMLTTFQCSKYSTAIIWMRDVLEDGLILTHTSWSMLIWCLRIALHTLLLPKVTVVVTMLNANQRLRFKTPNMSEEVSPVFQRTRWWRIF